MKINTAQKIVADPANSIQGEVQHSRIASAAEKQYGVKVSGSRNRNYYSFVDGSGITVNHVVGDFIVYPASI